LTGYVKIRLKITESGLEEVFRTEVIPPTECPVLFEGEIVEYEKFFHEPCNIQNHDFSQLINKIQNALDAWVLGFDCDVETNGMCTIKERLQGSIIKQCKETHLGTDPNDKWSLYWVEGRHFVVCKKSPSVPPTTTYPFLFASLTIKDDPKLGTIETFHKEKTEQIKIG